MDFVFVTGKLGQGKTLVSISKIKERIERGAIVATNCDLFLHRMFNRNTDKPRVIRVPDKPTLADLELIGRGHDFKKGYNESKNGLLVLDECGDWFNSRNWQDKDRAGLNTWMRHARKLGWDVYLIVQDISLIDNQARDSLAAAVARCKRIDKFSIPYFTQGLKMLTGIKLSPPRFHFARVEDGDGVLLDRWGYRGSELFSAYDTTQRFRHDYPHAVHSLLTPWHIYGRYSKPLTWSRFMRLTRIYLKQYSLVGIAVISGLVASAATFAFQSKITEKLPAISTKEEKPKEEAKPVNPPKTFSEEYETWSYDGAIVINNRTTYYLINARGIRTNSNDDLFEGITFSEPTHCVLKMRKSQEVAYLKCPNQTLKPLESYSPTQVASTSP